MILNFFLIEKSLTLVLALLLSIFLPLNMQAQQVPADSLETVPVERFTLDLEYRPRTEFRRGYRSLPNDSSEAAFFTSHRARLQIDYERNNFFFRASLQDIRVWGDTDPRDATGKSQFYEFYVEPSFNNKLSVRVGRQRIKYDNQRLFAENNWRQAGGQHDAVRFQYRGTKLNADLIGAFNQTDERKFGIAYDVPWDIYRTLIANFIKFQASSAITLTAINFADEYTDPATGKTEGYWKFTYGGRIAYETKSLHLTFAGYYQFGKIYSGKTHRSYYLEPELKWETSPRYTLSIGAQVFSGDNDTTDNTSTAFLAQYGAFHRYNGRMDYTQLTVRTYEHEGIINPYIQQDFLINKKLKISWESHILATEKELTVTQNSDKIILDKFYAWENDFRFFYSPNSFTTIELAYAFLLPDETLSFLPTGINGSTESIAQFAYLVVSWTPQLINWQKNSPLNNQQPALIKF